MLTKRIAREKINSLINRMKTSGLHPKKAILFGSVAKEKTHKYSDVDLALWADEFEGIRSFDYEKIARLMDGLNPLEIHTFNTSEDKDSNPFIEEIIRTGIEIKI
jgi:predicted nucleotidyltransferase